MMAPKDTLNLMPNAVPGERLLDEEVPVELLDGTDDLLASVKALEEVFGALTALKILVRTVVVVYCIVSSPAVSVITVVSREVEIGTDDASEERLCGPS